MTFQTVYIEITNRCNLNCRTCYNRSGLNRCTQEISIEQLEKIITTTAKYGANRFLFSGGEPSLHSHFHELLKLTEHYPTASFGFVTNGTVNDEVWIDYLNSHHNLTLQISLDGANEDQNALTRGSGNFDKTVAFAKKIHNPRMKALLKMVISKKNLDGVEPFYKLALDLGCVPEFAFIYKSGNGCDGWEEKALSAHEKIKVLKLIDALNKQYRVEAFLPKCTSTCPYTSNTDHMSICIKVDGSIQPCQGLYAPEFTLGNVFDFDEREVLNNLNTLSALMRQRKTMDFGCQKCMLKQVCGRGCMAEAFHLTNDPLGNDDGCMFRKLQLLSFDIRSI